MFKQRRRAADRWLPLLQLLLCLPAVVGAQTQQPIRSGIVLVPLDVRVVDRDGNPVTDLTAADFTVYENGIRQEIAHFLPMSLGDRDERLDEAHPLAAA